MGMTQHLGAEICVRLAHVNLLIFDSLGCAILGVDLPWSCILIDRLTSLDGSRACTICRNVPPSCCTPQSQMVRLCCHPCSQSPNATEPLRTRRRAYSGYLIQMRRKRRGQPDGTGARRHADDLLPAPAELRLINADALIPLILLGAAGEARGCDRCSRPTRPNEVSTRCFARAACLISFQACVTICSGRGQRFAQNETGTAFRRGVFDRFEKWGDC